jgi:divalent metal cation (Fe/Co/Zn/Cd) transporter
MKRISKDYRTAYLLALFTIAYNFIEGALSMYLGYEGGTLVLFGFGLDSLTEAISGLGIAIMIFRISTKPESPKSHAEIRALNVTGVCFNVLAAGLTVATTLNIIHDHKPETALGGIVISAVSILVMSYVVHLKNKEGKRLNSAPILADAICTKVCIYMSIILLAASLIYQLTGWEYVDELGTIGIVYFLLREGRDAFDKAKAMSPPVGIAAS